jgi:TRAP-type C4-dicarboxylate transport system substrate-binding protein
MKTVSWKKVLVPTLVLGLFAASELSQSVQAAGKGNKVDQPIEIRLATLALRGTSPHLAIEQMAQEWQKLSGGRVRVVVYPDYHQGEAAIVDKMGVRGIDAAVMANVGLSKIDDGITCLVRLPMGFRSLNEVDYAQAKLLPELEARLLKRGYVLLAVTDIGWVRIFSKQPVIFPSDLKKQKLFVWSGDTPQVDIMKDAGFNPVALETADILPGLSSGLIDAVPTTPAYANGAQFYTVTRHMLELNWAPLVGGAVIRKDSWEKIPPELRPALLKSAANMGLRIKEASRKENDEAVRAMERKHGLHVHRMTPETEQAWIAAAEAAYPKIRGHIVPADLFDSVQSLLKEYRSRATGNRK